MTLATEQLHAITNLGFKGGWLCMQVYACEIEEYMQELAQPYFERAGVAHKARNQVICVTPQRLQDGHRRGQLTGAHAGVQVEVVLGAASESIAKLAASGVRFDLAFLDADKTGYLGYYEQVPF